MRSMVLAALMLMYAPSAILAQCSDAEKQRLEEFDRAWGAANLRGDRAHLQRVYAEDYAALNPTGTVGKAVALENIMRQFESRRANPQNAPRVTWDNYVITCTPGTATVTHRNVVTTTGDGHERTAYSRSVHVLEKRDGRWQVIADAGHPLDDAGVLLYIENDWNEAERKRDVAWFERHFAEGATAVRGATGAMHSKAQLLESLKTEKTVLESLELSDMSVRVDGDAAVVTGINRVRGRDEQGKTFDRRVRFTDTYIKRDGRWQIWASQGTVIP